MSERKETVKALPMDVPQPNLAKQSTENAETVVDTRVVSEAKMLANQRNALKSTGPKDTSLTRFNALKHGLTAEKLVVAPFETPDEYIAILEGLRRDFKPRTTTEEILIQNMASALWRRLRLLKTETASARYESIDARLRYQGLAEFEWLGRVGKGKILEETREERGTLFVESRVGPLLNELRMRYETGLDGQFYRALLMLLQIQKDRAISQPRLQTNKIQEPEERSQTQ